ncbi:MAG: mandelate racemase/muconate lactonizing enzyme family protein [Cyclobacteriaceae bacterium]|nr:mandelate racemase/muconate lactonizing enzyme family protein [Cyclobacteriaceae bacterium HetDA_MAG_MS6]
MKSSRRFFLKQSSILGLGMASYPTWSYPNPSLKMRDQKPLIKDLHKSFSSPVIINSIDLLKTQYHLFVIVTSKDGVQGIIKANSRLKNTVTMFKNLITPFFIGKDARDLVQMMEDIYTYGRNYKYAGMPLWNAAGHAELAILDMLGQTARLPVNQLLGEVLRKEIPVYMSSTTRETTAEEEVEWVGRRIQETGAKAAKIKIGGRMSKNKDAYPGRSESLVKLARKEWGDDFILYVDANGSYDVPKAIEIGKFLQDYNTQFYEEPVPWEDFEGTRQVAKALKMTVAGGEQDSSMPKWKWMIDNKAVDLPQPDLVYNGGMIRTLQVARMAESAGMKVTPHSPKIDSQSAYMLHFASIVSNLGEHQEFHARAPKNEDYFTPNLRVKNGVVRVPDELPGFGFQFDQDYLNKGAKL